MTAGRRRSEWVGHRRRFRRHGLACNPGRRIKEWRRKQRVRGTGDAKAHDNRGSSSNSKSTKLSGFHLGPLHGNNANLPPSRLNLLGRQARAIPAGGKKGRIERGTNFQLIIGPGEWRALGKAALKQRSGQPREFRPSGPFSATLTENPRPCAIAASLRSFAHDAES